MFRVVSAAVFCLLASLVVSPVASSDELADQLIPMQAWIHDPVISSVSVSPDGNRLAALTLVDVNDAPKITVWDTRDLSKAPVTFAPKSTKAMQVGWLSNDRLFVVGRQKFDYRFGGTVTRWFRDRAYIVDAEGKRFREVLSNKESIGVSLFDSLPNQENKILVSVTNTEFAQDIYEVNLKNFLSKRIFRGATGESFFGDHEGTIRGRSKIVGRGDEARIEFAYRNPNTNQWEEHHALYAGKREGMQPVGFDPDGRTVYMVDNTGRDLSVIRPYDLLTRELGAPIFDEGAVEATTVLQSNQPEDFGEIIGYAGQGVGPYREYISDEWARIQRRIDDALPAQTNNTISSISRDFSIAVVRSTGPREPNAYYLFVNGQQLIALGRSYPFLEQDKLAEMRFVRYKARDGLEIPGYLTVPNVGEPPYPTVVVPHGGPWSRDSLRFDLWAQFLANRGYLVLQPQYRGSMGWGQELWRAGDREWGGTMQDDKDDGALWLVEEGLADPDRLAIFGYSYGGYAAMAAIVRPDTPYQCAIAGAGLSELRYFDKVTFEGNFGREFQNPTIKGLSPLDVAKNASIPIYIFHGDRDQRVPIEQSRKYVSALKKAGKDVEYEEIVDLWHSFPWYPQHHLAILGSVEEYLAERCGPGGL